MREKLKKKLLPALPFLPVWYAAEKLSWLYRSLADADPGERLLRMLTEPGSAFHPVWPSLHPADMLFGGLVVLLLAALLYLKKQEAKKFRQGTEYGSISDGKALRLLYAARLTEHLPETLPLRVRFSTGSQRLLALTEQIFRGGRGEEVTVQITEDGQRCSVYSERFGWIFYEKLLLMLCMHRLSVQEDVALPYWVPHAAEDMAKQHHRRILRYASRSDGSDTEARMLARAQGFTLDAGSLIAELLRVHAEDEPDLLRWMQALPPCYTVRRILPTDDAAAAAARCAGYLRTERTPEGLRAGDHRGSALLRPSGTGKTLSLLVEARSMEAASELAADIAGWTSAPRS